MATEMELWIWAIVAFLAATFILGYLHDRKMERIRAMAPPDYIEGPDGKMFNIKFQRYLEKHGLWEEYWGDST